MLLAEVLDDDDDEPKPPKTTSTPPISVPSAASTGNGGWPSLDTRYHEVLRELLTRSVWTAAEVRAIATRAKMMPGAILEALNTWSEERFGDYVIEEAGDWRINATVLERPTA